ncbi:MAG: hypothetical protein LBG17_06200 [Bacteroidales bacterium]|jgi:hypothetical protein|nr:hypothetical protein [Bacteroidales bacterium]
MKQYVTVLLCCASLLFPDALNAQSTLDKNLTKIISQIARKTAKKIVEEKGADSVLAYSGCLHVAALWNPKIDGDESVYEKFCVDNFVVDTAIRLSLCNAVSEYSRSIFGHQRMMEYELATMRDKGGRRQNWFDNAYAQYNPIRYYADNFYESKLAFAIALNFPYVNRTDKEKAKNNYQQWKYYRLGDMFVSRQPHEIGEDVIDAEYAMRQYVLENGFQKPDRFNYLLAFMQAQMKPDSYLKNNFLVRTLDRRYEISVDDIKNMIGDFLKSEEIKQTCKLLKNELGRNLTEEDIYTEEDDEIKYQYKSVAAFTLDMPRILENAGFFEADIQTMLQNIKIESTTNMGTYYSDILKNGKGYLLVNIDDTGVSPASFRKAIYDFGALVSVMIANKTLFENDFNVRRGGYFMDDVPNEYFAGGLGIYILEKNNSLSDLRYLNMMLKAGMALTEIYIWEAWYGNTSMTASVLKDEVQRIAKEVWNKYFYGYFGSKDNPLFASNDAMLMYPLMLPAAVTGNITEMRVRDVILNASAKASNDDTDLSEFFKKLCDIYSMGKLTPALWFKLCK